MFVKLMVCMMLQIHLSMRDMSTAFIIYQSLETIPISRKRRTQDMSVNIKFCSHLVSKMSINDEDESDADYCKASSDECNSYNKMMVTRRTSLASAALCLVTSIIPTRHYSSAHADSLEISDNANNNNYQRTIIPSLTIPLQYQPKLSAYTISYTIGTSQFGAIIDTGSPFLMVPQSSETSCSPEYEWGCFHPEESQPAPGLGPTLERYDGNEGLVEWRQGQFSFDIINSVLFPRSLMTFGVISESLMDGPGGIFLGLVKNTDGRIRPSFLGQSNVSSFSVDLRERGIRKTLTLYGNANNNVNVSSSADDVINENIVSPPSNLRTAQNAIPLVRDLNKRFGDPTIHYVGVASSINVNGSNLSTTSRRNGKIYCIFDTGCSGMSISPSLFDERYTMARTNKEKSLWGRVSVELKTISGKTVTLNANRPITTPLGSERPWGKKLDGHLIVLGLAFLDGLKMTVDIDGDKVWFED